MTPTPRAVLVGVSLLAAVLYGGWLASKPPSPLRSGVKTAAVGALAAIGWWGHPGWLLALGLTLSAAGDLVLSGDPRRTLGLGVASYLLAHAAYIVVFLHAGPGLLMFRAQPVRLAGALVAVSGAVLVVRGLWTPLQQLRGPAALYAAAVAGLALSAFTLPLSRWPAMAGAAAWALSDGLLAVRLLRPGTTDRRAGPAVFGLYYLGQGGIAAAFLLP